MSGHRDIPGCMLGAKNRQSDDCFHRGECRKCGWNATYYAWLRENSHYEKNADGFLRLVVG